MKTRFLSLFAICGMLSSSASLVRAIDATPAPAPTVTASSTAPRFSGRINEVVALTQSGVDQSIILSYIKTSPGPFEPSADEIIKLRDTGVPADIITAMMQRGAELRDQAKAYAAATLQNSQQAQSSASYAQPAQAAAAPVTPYVDPTYYPTYYSAPASSVVYIGGSYSYPYYNYCYPYSYPYYYSGYCGPTFRFGFGSPFFRFHDFDDFRFHGGFHDFHGGFRGGFSGGFRGGFTGGGFHGGFSGGGFRGGGGFHAGGGFHGGGGMRR